MTPQREYLDALKDILDAIENAQAFTQGMDFETFGEDQKTVYAVVRAIEIIGEAAKLIPEDVR